MNEAQIREKIACYTRFPHRGKLNIITDTTEFMNIKAGDVLELGGRFYLIRGEEVEGRFGMDGEPKFWVKKAVDLSDGKAKIIKLVFLESFVMPLGDLRIRCFRSPQKEARILDKVRSDKFFMQGFHLEDRAGNDVRVIDRIQGTRFYEYLLDLEMDHRTYFETCFPSIFDNVLRSLEALSRLHTLGEIHGDVRNDHLIIDRDTGVYTWIDFDYAYEWAENPFGVDLYGVGNILLFAAGKGFHVLHDLSACGPVGFQVKECLDQRDMSLFFSHRIMNLQKLFPYVPDSLNEVLLHFSVGAPVFYDSTQELLQDLRACRRDLGTP